MNDNNFFKRLMESVKEIKKKDAAICAGIAIVIIVLIINMYITNKQNQPSPLPNTSPQPSATDNSYTSTELEQRLSDILSKINGVGKVNVLITYADETYVSSGDSTTFSAKPQGVIIIAEGAEDLEVRIKIQQAVQTALGIEAHQIKIYEMGNN